MKMAKLYFRYGVMNSGKSMFLLSTAHNFKERNVPYLIMKPALDTRDADVIRSRALNTEYPCILLDADDNVYEVFKKTAWKANVMYKWILVDEAQFLTPRQVDELAELVDKMNVNVICYGLRTDFQTKLFPGSQRLFEVADSFEEMKSTCECGNKASVNARIDENGDVVLEGEQVECGAEDKYVTLCRKCYYKKVSNVVKKVTDDLFDSSICKDTNIDNQYDIDSRVFKLAMNLINAGLDPELIDKTTAEITND